MSQAQAIQHDPRVAKLVALRDEAYRLALRVSNAANAEDSVHDAYMRALRAGLPQRDDAALRLWFFQIVVNAARDRARGDTRRERREQEAAVDAVSATTGGADAAARLELRDAVTRALSTLDEKYRSALCLHYEQGLTYDDAAKVLSVPSGSLRAYASQGIQQLREILARQGHTVQESALCTLLVAGLPLTIPASLAASVQTALAGTSTGGGLVVGAGSGGMAMGTKVLLAGVCVAAFIAGGWLTLRTGLNLNTLLSPQPVQEPLAAPPQTPVPQPPPTPKPSVPAPEPITIAIPAPLGFDVTTEKPATAPLPLPDRFAGTVNLVESIDPAEHALSGDWSKVNGDLLSKPVRYSRLMAPLHPGDEYDAYVEFTRLGGDADINVMLPKNGRTLTCKLGAYGNSSHVLEGLTPKANLKRQPNILKDNLRYGVLMEVRDRSVTVYLNGEKILGEPLGDTVPTEAAWNLPDQTQFGLGTFNVNVAFHRIHIKTLKGEERLAVRDANTALVASPAYWESALDLLPRVDVNDAREHGWTADGTLATSDDRPFCKLDLGYAPPEEYDMRVVFSRISGKNDVVLVLTQSGRPFTLKLGTWGNFSHVLDVIDGKVSGNSPASVFGALKIGQEYTVVAQVRKTGVRIYMDGKLALNWPTNYQHFTIEKGWRFGEGKRLGIGSFESPTVFRRVQVKEMSGSGSFEKPAPANVGEF